MAKSPRGAVVPQSEQERLPTEASTSSGEFPAPVSESVRPREGSSDSVRRKKAREGKPESRPQAARFLQFPAPHPSVSLGADGKLPELALDAGSAAQHGEAGAAAPTSSWILYGVLALSLIASLGLLLIDPESRVHSSSATRDVALRKLSDFYGGEKGRTEPYQQLLCAALVDQSQGNIAASRRRYRQVIQLLNSVDFVESPNGLTGAQTGRGPSSDADLRHLLEIVIAR